MMAGHPFLKLPKDMSRVRAVSKRVHVLVNSESPRQTLCSPFIAGRGDGDGNDR